jgi:hypothetical protein
MSEREALPWGVGWARFCYGGYAILFGVLFLFLFSQYFSARFESEKALLFVGGHVLIGLMAGLLGWMWWAFGQRIRASWYVYLWLVALSVVWMFVAYFWLKRPLFRSGNMLTFCHLINLLWWFNSETKAWFHLGVADSKSSAKT